jgi:predicted enzyme related to lactoylglutathione lyase
MAIDPTSPVVQLCILGMQAEARGRLDEARDTFAEAWSRCTNDLEASIAAHYLARHQDDPQATLRWNEEALRRADAVGDAQARDFYPSLYLNMGWSHEQLGDRYAAHRWYTLAAQYASALPADAYGATVREGAAAGIRRLATAGQEESMGLFQGINVVSISVPDLDRAREFYGTVLGLGTPVFDLPDAGWIEFATGSAGGNLAVTAAAADWAPSAGTTVVLNTSDCATACAELRARGVRCDDPVVFPGYVTYCSFYDPFGNRLQMCSPPPAE